MSNNNQAPKSSLVITDEITRIMREAIARSIADMDVPSREVLIAKLHAAYKKYKGSGYYLIRRIPTVYIPLLKTGKIPQDQAFIDCAKATKLGLDRLLEELVTIRTVFLPKKENPQT